MEKLKLLWEVIKTWAGKLYAWSPLLVGILIGYYGKPVIKLAIDAIASLIKLVIKA